MGLGRIQREHRQALKIIAESASDPSALVRLKALLLSHFEMEEKRLLPLLADRLPSETGPISVILEEHRTIRSILSGPPDPLRLAALLGPHFSKEEELILPFAESHLSPEEMASIEEETA